MAIVNKEIFYLVPQFMDQGILKNIFMNHVSQIPKNFPKKLKDILTYLSKTEKIDRYFFWNLSTFISNWWISSANLSPCLHKTQ